MKKTILISLAFILIGCGPSQEAQNKKKLPTGLMIGGEGEIVSTRPLGNPPQHANRLLGGFLAI